jgi:hypothetical protein
MWKGAKGFDDSDLAGEDNWKWIIGVKKDRRS